MTLPPVILHQCLSNSLYHYTLSHHFRVRVSNSVLPNSVIFPVAGVAFIVLIPPSPITHYKPNTSKLDTGLQQNIDKFIQIHRHCYVLVPSKYGPEMFSLVQESFLHTKLQVLPVNSPEDAVKAMSDISKLLCKPVVNVMYERFDTMLKSQMTDGVFESILSQIGLDQHHILDICVSLGSSLTFELPCPCHRLE
ncbi:hypothetical protein ScPMuIL_013480 [Solemya velum]